jgi:hypothetical protein
MQTDCNAFGEMMILRWFPLGHAKHLRRDMRGTGPVSASKTREL